MREERLEFGILTHKYRFFFTSPDVKSCAASKASYYDDKPCKLDANCVIGMGITPPQLEKWINLYKERKI